VQEILDKDKEEEEFPNEIVLEVRAGAGRRRGVAFCLGAGAYVWEIRGGAGWQWRVNYESKSDLNGYKEASFEIKGKRCF